MNETLENIYCVDDSFHGCNIDQKNIDKLNKLKVLVCHGNNKIYDVNHLSETLEELHCGNFNMQCSSIDQRGLSKLKNLKKLVCTGNGSINNANHLAETLTFLDCSSHSGIDDIGIYKLHNLKHLTCIENKNIKVLRTLEDIKIMEKYMTNSPEIEYGNLSPSYKKLINSITFFNVDTNFP